MDLMTSAVALPTLDLQLPGGTYIGPAIDDFHLAEAIPLDLWAVINDVNGFIAFDGAFHVRGITAEPLWHSLGSTWKGERALHLLFPALSPDDIPFAQDGLGDQFIFRAEEIWRLAAETGELRSTGLDIQDFLRTLIDTPQELLPTQFVRRFLDEGGVLQPGQLLSVYPPLCTRESEDGISLRAMAAVERIDFLADFAAQIAEHLDGSRVHLRIDTSGAS
jgi:hypothetical protein